MFTTINRRGSAVFALVLLVACCAAAQQPTPSIMVTGDVKQPLILTPADLAAMPRATLPNRGNTIQRAWEGVWLTEILKKAGVSQGAALRGSALTSYVIVSASDGYQVLFSLGELDPEMTGGQFLVADTANGTRLATEGEGFRLVIPNDKQGARSVRDITKIEVVQVRK